VSNRIDNEVIAVSVPDVITHLDLDAAKAALARVPTYYNALVVQVYKRKLDDMRTRRLTSADARDHLTLIDGGKSD
jgi:hypothetical protein